MRKERLAFGYGIGEDEATGAGGVSHLGFLKMTSFPPKMA
jgi:hypothetical protein